MLKKFFVSKDVNTVLEVLRHLDHTWHGIAFELVKNKAEKIISSNAKDTRDAFRQGMTPECMVYNLFSNITQGMILSGEHHIYRGALDTMGQDLVRIFNLSLTNLARIGILTKEKSNDQIQALQKAIKNLG